MAPKDDADIYLPKGKGGSAVDHDDFEEDVASPAEEFMEEEMSASSSEELEVLKKEIFISLYNMWLITKAFHTKLDRLESTVDRLIEALKEKNERSKDEAVKPRQASPQPSQSTPAPSAQPEPAPSSGVSQWVWVGAMGFAVLCVVIALFVVTRG